MGQAVSPGRRLQLPPCVCAAASVEQNHALPAAGLSRKATLCPRLCRQLPWSSSSSPWRNTKAALASPPWGSGWAGIQRLLFEVSHMLNCSWWFPAVLRNEQAGRPWPCQRLRGREGRQSNSCPLFPSIAGMWRLLQREDQPCEELRRSWRRPSLRLAGRGGVMALQISSGRRGQQNVAFIKGKYFASLAMGPPPFFLVSCLLACRSEKGGGVFSPVLQGFSSLTQKRSPC